MGEEKYTLYTIPFSHYCLMARWALTVHGKPFEEVCYMPAFHFFGPMKRLRMKSEKMDKDARNLTSVPLVTSENSGTDESQLAAKDSWECLKLVGEIDPVLQTVLDEVVGPCTRTIVYHHVLGKSEDHATLKLFLKYPTSTFQRVAIQFSPLRWTIRYVLRSAMAKDEEMVSKARKDLTQAFEKIHEMIQADTTKAFDLKKSSPTASVIAVASMTYPVLVEDVNESPLLDFQNSPKSLQEEILKWRQMPLGQWVLGAYNAYLPHVDLVPKPQQ